MKSLRKVEDINNFKDGTFLIQHVKGVYCECGYEQGETTNADGGRRIL
jgi:hypothetical protein